MLTVRSVFGLCLLFCALPAESLAQPSPVYQWRLDRSHLDQGSFIPTHGDFKLAASQNINFVGEGKTEALLRMTGHSILSAGRISPDALPKKQISLTAWAAMDVESSWGGIICAVEDNGDYERGFVLGNRGKEFCFALSTEKAGRLTYLSGAPPAQPGKWYFVAGSYDGKKMRLYLNGRLVAESDEQQGKILYHQDHELCLGAYKDQNEDYRLNGAIYRASIYDQALSGSFIKRLYREGRDRLPEPGGPTFTSIDIPEAPELPALQPRINKAIDRGVDYLLQRQLRDGSWDINQEVYRNGGTALALYALLKSGLPKQHPSSVMALRYLAKKDPTRTYSTGCQLLALSAINNPKHKQWAQRLVDNLLFTESLAEPGGWAYPDGGVDLSNTQFAALGFWAGSKFGIKTPREMWQRVVRKTVEEHQPNIREVESFSSSAGPSGRNRIGGFTYFKGGASYPETGSMTTAGLCVLALAEEVAGKRLGTSVRRLMESSKPLALGWLDLHYSVTSNPGNQGVPYYYLYGLERVGALLEMETIGDHPWYRDGASFLVDTQAPDGLWNSMENTCFSLLFLTRATGTLTGPQMTGEKEAWTTERGLVHLRATGPGALSFWISGISRDLGNNLRIRKVRYLADGEEVLSMDGDPTLPWKGRRFAGQHQFFENGEHTLQAIIELTEPAGEAEMTTLRSDILTVTTRPDPEAWMQSCGKAAGENLMSKSTRIASASSVRADHRRAPLAVDEREATAWVCKEHDEDPWIRVTLDPPVRADTIVLSPADARLDQLGNHDRAVKLSIVLNGKGEAQEVLTPLDPLEQVFIPLDKKKLVHSLLIRVLEREPGQQDIGCVGFAEIALRLKN